MPLDRREFLAATAAAWAAPRFEILRRRKPKLRVLGTHVTLKDAILGRAREELDLDIEYLPGGSSFVLQKAASRPESFDVYEQWSDSVRILWQAKAIRPLETSRIERWDEVNDLAKKGRISEGASVGAGDAPFRILNVQSDGTLGTKPTGRIAFLPYTHNVDSFGYDSRTVPEGTPYESESWGWLLDPQWKGRAGMVNAPTIGIFDMALAARARGLMTFRDIGAMTRDEIDTLFDIMIAYRQRGHFSGVWNSVPESVEFMRKGRVVIESMFSPAVTDLNAQGIPARYAAPKEGYRAWHGVMCLSSHVSEEAEEAAYKFMNWWTSGWPGALMARQGYYISNPQRTREHLEKYEWDYWYGGKPAERDLRGIDGRVTIKKGEVRRGGAYEERVSNIAVWNTVMDTYEYSLPHWYEFLSS